PGGRAQPAERAARGDRTGAVVRPRPPRGPRAGGDRRRRRWRGRDDPRRGARGGGGPGGGGGGRRHLRAEQRRQASRGDQPRRRYLAILLANITAGVISTDAEGRITTLNRAAETLLGVRAAACIWRPLDEVLAGEPYAEIRQLSAGLLANGTDGPPYAITFGPPLPRLDVPSDGGATVERQMRLRRDGHDVAVLLTGTRLLDDAGSPQGLVLFLEEVTHLLRVQRMEAWREVARRIAHEIKNPLTPIQLSAQRLRRRYAGQLRDGGAVFDECTRTIVQQVD